MVNPKEQSDEASPLDEFIQQLRGELEQAQSSLKEINMMMEQSEGEATKLAERNKQFTLVFQQAEKQFESLPRAEIKTTYSNYLETKEKLFIMRGQLDKLQNDKSHLSKYVVLLKKVLAFVEEGNAAGQDTKGGGGMETLALIVQSQEEERKRLSRQMHDGPAQTLSNFIVQAEIAARCFEVDPSRAKEELDALKSAAMGTFQKVRSFIFDLRPMMLDDLGLVPTVRRYVDSVKEQNKVTLNLSIDGEEGRIEPYLEVMIFRAVQELITNAIRHNSEDLGTLQITVQMHIEDVQVKVFIADNGKGFVPENISQGSGLGLRLIKERAEMVGGFMEIDSSPGQGCNIVFQVPCSRVTKNEGKTP
jgi:two-component system sensor histidine kinase DegS